MKNLKREFSSGCVVYRREKRENIGAKNAKITFLLGKHSGYHKWVLPKGLIEKGETSQQAAIRETKEEMGVDCRLVQAKPISLEEYFYYADLKEAKPKTKIKNPQENKATRRVVKYQESGGRKTKIFKTVTFYLAEAVAGDPQEHGWEMEDAGWFNYQEALKIMAFKQEKEVLEKAFQIVS